ncbi:MAG: hypothetical protein LBH04_00790 [Tannerellaceae bacterium]|jgi:hypothetical protein|nr:hypothetical protein [Tannerellaceae bacterium]
MKHVNYDINFPGQLAKFRRNIIRLRLKLTMKRLNNTDTFSLPRIAGLAIT